MLSIATQTTASFTYFSIPPPEKRKILIICQESLNLYIKSLREINLENISIITCNKNNKENTKFRVVCYINEYFNSHEVEKYSSKLLKDSETDLIIATSETDILRVARLRDLFKIPGQTYQSALLFRDKLLMKELLSTKGIEVPPFRRVNSFLDILEFVDTHSFPCILKPARGYGSLKTTVFQNQIDLDSFLENSDLFNEFHETHLDIERFIDWNMYHIDGIVREGKIIAAWPSKYINTCLEMAEGKPTGSYLLPPSNPLIEKLIQYTQSVLLALPTPRDTGFHLEVFCDGKDVIFCEIASRIGGPWINDVWIRGMNLNLKKEFIRAQALLPPLTDPCCVAPHELVGGIIFPPRKGIVKKIKYNCDLSRVIDYQAFLKVEESLSSPDGMLGHILYFIFNGTSQEEIEQKAEEIISWVDKNIEIS